MDKIVQGGSRDSIVIHKNKRNPSRILALVPISNATRNSKKVTQELDISKLDNILVHLNAWLNWFQVTFREFSREGGKTRNNHMRKLNEKGELLKKPTWKLKTDQ